MLSKHFEDMHKQNLSKEVDEEKVEVKREEEREKEHT